MLFANYWSNITLKLVLVSALYRQMKIYLFWLFFKCPKLQNLGAFPTLFLKKYPMWKVGASLLSFVYFTRENSYSIGHILGIVTTQWLDNDGVVTVVLDSDGVVTVVNCWQRSDYTIDQLCIHCAASSCQQWLHCHCVVTVPSRWLME